MQSAASCTLGSPDIFAARLTNGGYQKQSHSLHVIPTQQMRTLPTLMFGHVANAAFVCSCSGALFAVQRVSPKEPFKLVTHAGSYN